MQCYYKNKLKTQYIIFMYFVVIFTRVLCSSRKLQNQLVLKVLTEFACAFFETAIHHLHFYMQTISHSCRNTGNTCCFQVPEGILKNYTSKSHFIEKIAWIEEIASRCICFSFRKQPIFLS